MAAGAQKPVSYLLFAAFFSFVGMFGSMIVLVQQGFFASVGMLLLMLLLSGLFVWLYAINKRFFVSIYPQGGPPIMLSLKPNLIEGVPLDLDRALRVVKLFREKVLASHAPSPATPLAAVVSANGNHAAASHVGQTMFSGVEQFEPEPESFSGWIDAVESDPESLLRQARDLIATGGRAEAIVVLRDIISRFPTSREATMARSTLDKAGLKT